MSSSIAAVLTGHFRRRFDGVAIFSVGRGLNVHNRSLRQREAETATCRPTQRQGKARQDEATGCPGSEAAGTCWPGDVT